MAALVAFSRVYCGVHYPADVTAGAILGAGYAICLTVVVQSAWNVIGRKFFPRWHQQLPSLVNPFWAIRILSPETNGNVWVS